MSTNSSATGSILSGLDSVNATLGGSDEASTALGLVHNLHFLLLEAKLLASALGIIYLGSHASLRRPPSASPSASAKDKTCRKQDKEENAIQGLEPSDAIIFPLLASMILVGLYYLIQWLNDPTLLNKILRWYMSTMSTASLLTLYSHFMQLGTSLLFPRYWRGRDGNLRKVSQSTRSVSVCDDVGNAIAGAPPESNPLPGSLAVFASSSRTRAVAWELRGLLYRPWDLDVFIHGIVEHKAQIKLAHVMAFLLSVATALTYFSTSWPLLSNVLGSGMCYASFFVLSPTDFLTGSLVLVGLFVYDVVMVFYTPYMVTVATQLDIPIKLTFQSAKRQSMLGLGDIVIPGMVIAWALRLDLWLFYLTKVKYEATDLKIMQKDATSGELVIKREKKHKEIKARYVDVKGRWGDALWTRGNFFLGRAPRQQQPTELAASVFPKTYFKAAMTGYLVGMMVTLTMLLVFKQGQPALLYLVPGVLGALLVTALRRGEMKKVWMYTEDGSLDTMDVVVDLDGEGQAAKTIGKVENGIVDLTKGDGSRGSDDSGDRKGDNAKEESDKEASTRPTGRVAKGGHRVLLLSLEAPSENEAD
ncbi:hypothetical protein CDD81_3077 [Ophiocordyceps australis]|uniref:Uncharacterized protein n=1 Tax=Ophiocordyceps australis TaxID=1399860 RepID=A0A2C5XJV9_9HYPO|nr:hypothetical protein CDD81_3077 [Ophiocordyceps australis]